MAHGKLGSVKRMREATDSILLRLPLPRINPNVISGLSILTSLLFLLVLNLSAWLALAFIMVTIVLDWLDGLVAKKHNLCSEEGYMVDIASDRLSEGIMFIPFFMPWFFLFALNNVLALAGFTRNRHIILPLRHLFLIWFLVMLFV